MLIQLELMFERGEEVNCWLLDDGNEVIKYINLSILTD